MSTEQFQTSLTSGLRKIVADPDSRLWLVDFIHRVLNPVQTVVPSDTMRDDVLTVEGRRQVFQRLMIDVNERIERPGVRASLYLDVIEGAYLSAFAGNASKMDKPDGEREPDQ